MEIIFVKTTTCAKCRQLLPIFEEYCKNNNFNYRVITFDTASEEDKQLAINEGVSAVPSLIFIENGFKRAYSVETSLASIVYAKNQFDACKEV